ncbi:hypothetical protein DSM106972_002380 [Dulcicalothrix desertica PCC 7102]|uniref:Restriction endonuclease type IV Mrr domain-containing protein n=1 Tax=Dulcicalothrix desertica PCC 7102 TaxID=232991 RepID=A0A3S1CSK8_9CYAN|nr:restriction endonuclease [Dulcicalothrix desertica]RUT09743.1 hypothetical protein DSM106972_002380 [Dulcicalothrix desertica PCC 7102]TWH50935.1 restriction endonuclease [Dulcicalothrix desertica PCC 7102]
MELMSTFLICATCLWVLNLAIYLYESASKTEEVEKKELDIIKLLNLNHSQLINKIDGMLGKEFESFLLRLLERFGYWGYQTADSGDYGADLIVFKDGLKIVVQAKRYSKSVGVKAIQEVLGAVKYYNADKALVITNSRFTKGAYKLAASGDVDLCDRSQLFDLIVMARGDNQKLSYS